MNPAEYQPSGLFCALPAQAAYFIIYIMSSVPRCGLMAQLPPFKGLRQRVAELFLIPAVKKMSYND